MISVVIPVLNGEPHLEDQLEALAGQTYSGRWEVVIADNGCTDGTLAIARRERPGLPEVRIADATARRGINHARNAGAAAAGGDFLAFCDADDVVSPGWLDALASAASGADLVGGRNEWSELNEPEVIAWRPSSPMTELMRGHDFLPYTAGGNMGVWADTARELRWDEGYRFGGSDQEFAWRAQLGGYEVAFAPDALVQLRFRRSIRATARQFYRYGVSGAQLHRAFRHAGIPRHDNRDALRRWWRLVRSVPDLWGPRNRRGYWVRVAAFRWGRLVGSLRARALVL
jgi:glycosyltransferase involved in cell wall biosynthesis